MDPDRITVRDVEFVVARRTNGESAVFVCTGRDEAGQPALSGPGGGPAGHSVREILAELPAGATVIVAEPATVASNGSSADTVHIGGQGFKVSQFADGVPVVYDCIANETYGVTCRKHFRPSGEFDALLLERALVVGMAVIFCVAA